MPRAPPVVVVAQVGERGEKPRTEACVSAQSAALLIEPDKDLRHQVLGVRLVLAVTIRKAVKRSLPSLQDPIESVCLPPL